jgi:diguanylate cyclase (GGDEF)-like protein/PAS domain S-box-containing protein
VTTINPNHQLYRAILDSLSEAVYFVDRSRRITYWNRAAEELTGYSANRIVGTSCPDGLLCHVDDAGTHLCQSGCPLTATMNDGASRHVEVYLKHAEGHRVPVRVRTQPVRADDGEIIGAVESFSDSRPRLSELERLRQLERDAFVDPLTGIGNRRYTEKVIGGRLEEQRRYGWPFGVLFIDLDSFKEINDRRGHVVGDRVLTMAAATLINTLRPFDFAGRWGGEELVAVLANADREVLGAVGERYRTLVASGRVLDNAEHVAVTVSIGAAVARCGDTMETLIERADQLMYASKRSGRNRVTLEPEP